MNDQPVSPALPAQGPLREPSREPSCEPGREPAPSHPAKTWWRRHRNVLLGMSAILLMRSAVANWHPIPSASMQPTLKEGDVVLVDRTAYGIKWPLTDHFALQGQPPARGDIITFSHPQQGHRLIKRVVAVAGDVVAMRGGRVWLNGEPVSQALQPSGWPQAKGPQVDQPSLPASAPQRWTETLGAHAHDMQWLPGVPALRDFPEVTVPSGHVLVLGDNRDNSADSRYFGFVPLNLIEGRAHHLLLSLDPYPPWRPRRGRFGMLLQ